MINYLKQLHWQILIAMLLGVSLSFLLPPNKLSSTNEAEFLEVINQNRLLDWFIETNTNLVKIEINLTSNEAIENVDTNQKWQNFESLQRQADYFDDLDICGECSFKEMIVQALNRTECYECDVIYNSDSKAFIIQASQGYIPFDSAIFFLTLIETFDDYKNFEFKRYKGINSFNQYIYLLGDIFMGLLKMIIIPLIITSIIVGITNINDKATIGRLGRKTFGYYLLTSIVAIITGLALANILRPGDTFSLEYLTGEDLSHKAKSVKDLVMSFIMNPIQAAASGKTLPSIFFAILLGIAINYLPKDLNKSAVSFFDAMYRAILRITTWIIKLAPIGVFALIFKTLNTSGLELLKSVLVYSMTLVAGLSIHLLITLPIIFYLFTKINPLIHYRAILPAMFTAFSTSSSSATLPVTMNCSTKNAGVSKNVSGFVLPLGSTVNMDGTALFECAGVLFISQILGVNLDLSAQLTVVMIAFLASVGAAGVPHAGLVMIFIVLDAVGLSSHPQVPLIVATMFAIDRPLDMMRTMVNVTSDTVGASVIAKSEGENLYSKES